MPWECKCGNRWYGGRKQDPTCSSCKQEGKYTSLSPDINKRRNSMMGMLGGISKYRSSGLKLRKDLEKKIQ